MQFSLPRVCRQRRKLGRHLCTSGRPDGLCGVGGHLRRPRGGLGCIGAGEWTCGCGGQAAHTSSRDITKLRKYQESARRFFFPGVLTCHVRACVRWPQRPRMARKLLSARPSGTSPERCVRWGCMHHACVQVQESAPRRRRARRPCMMTQVTSVLPWNQNSSLLGRL